MSPAQEQELLLNFSNVASRHSVAVDMVRVMPISKPELEKKSNLLTANNSSVVSGGNLANSEFSPSAVYHDRAVKELKDSYL